MRQEELDLRAFGIGPRVSNRVRRAVTPADSHVMCVAESGIVKTKTVQRLLTCHDVLKPPWAKGDERGGDIRNSRQRIAVGVHVAVILHGDSDGIVLSLSGTRNEKSGPLPVATTISSVPSVLVTTQS